MSITGSVREIGTFLDAITIPPEIYGLLFIVLVLRHFDKHIKVSPDLKERYHRLLATMLSKKFIAWGVVTIMFWYDHFVWQYMGLDWLSYLGFTCGVFTIDVAQKKVGLGEKEKPSE